MTNNGEYSGDPELVEIITTQEVPLRWEPVVGPETLALLDTLDIPDQSKKVLCYEARQTLGRCVPPTIDAATETGLVIGYVQSGKTMSFTSVATLARDNEFHMVIVIGGTSIPLFEQSKTRLRKDLRLDERPDRKWQHFTNPGGDDIRAIRNTLLDWNDPTAPKEERQTVLVTVMKNHRHLGNLIQVLEQLDLQQTPTLVIDDEGDQASLNTRVLQGGESTTYRRINEMRQELPNHTFLQYTATPQAPLLINIIDTLSPSFAEVLTPGAAYVGGQEFFVNSPRLIRGIPQREIPTRRNRLTEPPRTLLDAMQIFFLGVAAGNIINDGVRNRSMMVHPSMHTRRHNQFFHWVIQVKDRWQETLALPESDPDRQELMEDFRFAYNDLSDTVPDLPGFEELVERLPYDIRKTRTQEINASRGRTPQIDWSAAYAYILVGGQAMDRGFTVEGLTVTYMPRHIGVGNADTVQQRGRFFGYKSDYLGYCRVFLNPTAQHAYESYVDHERDIRQQLLEFRGTGKPLSEWRRAFLMPARLRPTRRNVLDIDYVLGHFRDDWYTPGAPHDDEDAIRANWNVVDQFLNSIELHEDDGHNDRTDDQRHLVNTGVPLSQAHGELLVQFRVTRPRDSQQITGLLLQIRDYLEEHPSETCTVYQIRHFNGEWRKRRRRLNDRGEILNLFQGAYPTERRVRGSIYPGDRNIGDHDRVIIQIHKLTITTSDGQIVEDDVATLAVWIPAKMEASWLVQDGNIGS